MLKQARGGGTERLRKLAKHMRREPTATERLLWAILRDRKLEGLKFRRQVPIERWIVDFVCFEHRLIVEADGWTHEDSVTDPIRDASLRAEGFRILRFPNEDVHSRRDDVLNAILVAVGRA